MAEQKVKLLRAVQRLHDGSPEPDFIEAVLAVLSKGGTRRVRLNITFPTAPRRRGEEFKSNG